MLNFLLNIKKSRNQKSLIQIIYLIKMSENQHITANGYTYATTWEQRITQHRAQPDYYSRYRESVGNAAISQTLNLEKDSTNYR